MSTALEARTENVPQDTTMQFVNTIEARWRMATALVKSGMISYKQPEAAFAVMLKAHELGVPAMQGFATIHFFDGKLAIASSLMVGLAINRCGVTYKVVEWTDLTCKLEFFRKGWEPLPSEFTMEDAKRANLTNKDNWKKYPKAMLLARAQAQGIRAIAPDFFAGTYAVEEMEGDTLNHAVQSQASDLNARLDSVDEHTGEVVDGIVDETQGSLI